MKKQIEVYDQLIVQTKADIDASTPSPISQKSTTSRNSNKQLRKIVQPQIKTPKQHSLNESISPTSQQSSIDETSASTDTIIVSPHKATPTPISDSEEVCPPEPPAGVTPGALSLSRGDAIITATDSNLNYSDDFTSSISISSAVPTPSAGGSQPLKDKTVLVDAICGQLLEAMIEDTVGKMKIQQRSQSQSVSGGIIAGLPVDSGPYPVPGIIPTSPTISNETPSSVPCTSPKSRAKVDMMQTAFDISSESSEEGTYVQN